MYGFQIVQLIINSSSDFKIFDMSKMNNFKLVLNGRDPNKSDMDFMLEAEGQTQDEIHEKIQKQITNLKLYLNLYSDNAVDVKARSFLINNVTQFSHNFSSYVGYFKYSNTINLRKSHA